MNKYTLTLKSDKGLCRVTTASESIQDAIKKVLTIENALESAIKKIEIKDIKK